MKQLTLALILGLAAQAADSTQSFTGVITDTMCGAAHHMMKDQPDDKCIRMCVNGSSGYALFDGTTIWKLTDQKTPAKFAAKKVTVVGTGNAKSKTIKVVSISLAE